MISGIPAGWSLVNLIYRLLAMISGADAPFVGHRSTSDAVPFRIMLVMKAETGSYVTEILSKKEM